MADTPQEKPEENRVEVAPPTPPPAPPAGGQTPKVYTKQDFIDGFNALVKEMGQTLSFTPVFVRRDDGTFSVVVQQEVVPVPKNTP